MKTFQISFFALLMIVISSTKAMEEPTSEKIQKAVIVQSIKITPHVVTTFKNFRIMDTPGEKGKSLSLQRHPQSPYEFDDYFDFVQPLLLCMSPEQTTLLSAHLPENAFIIVDWSTQFSLTYARSLSPEAGSWWPFSNKWVDYGGHFSFKDYFSCLSNGTFIVDLKLSEKQTCVNNKILELVAIHPTNKSDLMDQEKSEKLL